MADVLNLKDSKLMQTELQLQQKYKLGTRVVSRFMHTAPAVKPRGEGPQSQDLGLLSQTPDKIPTIEKIILPASKPKDKNINGKREFEATKTGKKELDFKRNVKPKREEVTLPEENQKSRTPLRILQQSAKP